MLGACVGNAMRILMLPATQPAANVLKGLQTSPGLNMRIGLHHGSFVAGVIGSNQLRFDIWGEARRTKKRIAEKEMV